MQHPKQAFPPARKNRTPKKQKPDSLSVFEISKLGKAGRSDGQHALPKQDENGAWISPHLQKETNTYNELCVLAWGELQEAHENDHKEINRLCQEIPRLEKQLTDCRESAPSLTDLSVRIKGEEKLSEHIVRKRRQREFEKNNAGYFRKLRQLEDSLEQNYRHLSELQSVVQAAENTTRLQCEQARSHTLQRIPVYWNNVLRVHPKFKIIPPVPKISLESNAEAEYFAQNKSIQSEAARLLSRGAGISKNSDRTEEDYVSEQKN